MKNRYDIILLWLSWTFILFDIIISICTKEQPITYILLFLVGLLLTLIYFLKTNKNTSVDVRKAASFSFEFSSYLLIITIIKQYIETLF